MQMRFIQRRSGTLRRSGRRERRLLLVLAALAAFLVLAGSLQAQGPRRISNDPVQSAPTTLSVATAPGADAEQPRALPATTARHADDGTPDWVWGVVAGVAGGAILFGAGYTIWRRRRPG